MTTLENMMLLFTNSTKHQTPITQKFTQQYKQTSSGYISYGKKLGLSEEEIDQKFHLIHSYILRSLANGTINMNTNFFTLYNRFQCPELVLYIAEVILGENHPLVSQASKNAKQVIDLKGTKARSTATKVIRELIPSTLLSETLLLK